MRVLQAAELSALAAIFTGLFRAEPIGRGMPRHQVLFAMKIWRPETMDDIDRAQLELDGLSDWHMDQVRRFDDPGKVGILVLDFPPPLMTREAHLNGVWINL